MVAGGQRFDVIPNGEQRMVARLAHRAPHQLVSPVPVVHLYE
jgi:hypothetical protein